MWLGLKGSGRTLIRGALGAALFLLLLSPAPARAATLLYPNLKTLPPRDLRFDRVNVDPEGSGAMHNVLRFSNTVWNSGPGPLEMRGTIDPETNTGDAVQRVYDDSGGYTDFPAGTFYYHPEHDHYHYDDWGRYELWTKAGYEAWLASGRTEGDPIVGSKTTSCMIDEEFIRNVPNQPYPPKYGTEGCFPDSEGHMLQGISPGWGDTYDYFRFEQWIDLGASGTLADGQYVLRSVADPLNKIHESPGKADASREGAEDNEAVTPFAVEGGELVDSNPPSGSVRINDIDAATASPNVIVKVLGRDDISGVTEVRLSNDGSAWSAPQPYTGQESTAQKIAWNLADSAYGGESSDGTKTVYAEFHDASGKWSEPVSDTIVLDRSGNSSPYSNAVLSDSPAGYWRLGEVSDTTASDSAGANPGTYRNGPLLDQPSLLPADTANGAVKFDGINDCVEIPSSSSLSPPNRVSVEAWIKPAALPGSGEFASVTSKPGSYSLQFNGRRLEFKIRQGGGESRLDAAEGTIEAGHAYHVVGTYDGATQRLYVDGAEVAGKSLTGTISSSGEELSIGCWNEGREPFDGTIDEVAVYTDALPAARVEAHYQAGIGGEPPDLSIEAPSDLTATAASDTSIELHWSDNSDNEGEFRIERDTDPEFPSPAVEAVWADSTSFTDTELSPNTTYYYRVRARNATESSDFSNVASATTLPSPPEEPESPEEPEPEPEAPPVSPSSGPPLTHSLVPAPRYAAVAMRDLPVGYWPLGGAARFDRVDRYIEIPSSRPLRLTRRVSVEAWIKPAALPRPGKFAFVAGKLGAYAIRLDGHRLTFAIRGPRRRHRVQARDGLIAPGRVHHVVATYDGKVQRLFVDGVRVATGRFRGPIASSAHPFDIGGLAKHRGLFRGTIHRVAVYAKALSAARVRAHYRAGRWPRRNK